MKQHVWENVHKPAGMHVKNYVQTTANGHVVPHVVLDVIMDVQRAVPDVKEHANHIVLASLICTDVLDVVHVVDVHHHVSSIVIRIVSDKDADHYVV